MHCIPHHHIVLVIIIIHTRIYIISCSRITECIGRSLNSSKSSIQSSVISYLGVSLGPLHPAALLPLRALNELAIYLPHRRRPKHHPRWHGSAAGKGIESFSNRSAGLLVRVVYLPCSGLGEETESRLCHHADNRSSE